MDLVSNFIEHKVEYLEIQKLARLPKLTISAGEHNACLLWWLSPRQQDNGEYLSLAVAMLNETDANTHLVFEIFFMGKDGLLAASQGFRFDAWWRFVKLSELDSRYVVTFICGLIILRNHNEPIAVPPSNLGNQLGIMVGSANGSDISFSVGGEMFHAHRAVLAARSPMFHAEFFLVEWQRVPSRASCWMTWSWRRSEHYCISYTSTPFCHERRQVNSSKPLWCADTYNCIALKKKCFEYFLEDNNCRKIVATEGGVGAREGNGDNDRSGIADWWRDPRPLMGRLDLGGIGGVAGERRWRWEADPVAGWEEIGDDGSSRGGTNNGSPTLLSSSTSSRYGQWGGGRLQRQQWRRQWVPTTLPSLSQIWSEVRQPVSSSGSSSMAASAAPPLVRPRLPSRRRCLHPLPPSRRLRRSILNLHHARAVSTLRLHHAASASLPLPQRRHRAASISSQSPLYQNSVRPRPRLNLSVLSFFGKKFGPHFSKTEITERPKTEIEFFDQSIDRHTCNTNMLASGFVECKLDYLESEKIAIDDSLPETKVSAGEHHARIRLYPRGIEGGHGEHVSIFMFIDDVDDDDPRIDAAVFEVFLTDKHGAPSPQHARRSTEAGGTRVMGWHRFIRRGDLESSHVVDGVATFVCGLVVLRDDDGDDRRRWRPCIAVPPPNLAAHLAGMVGCPDGSDVSFSVGGETLIHAHRAVLAARSPVFRAELLGSMAEATMPCVTLHDIEPATFRALLHLVYTDALPASSTSSSTAAAAVECIDFLMEDSNFKKAAVTDDYLHLYAELPVVINEIKARLQA
uniref:BTB domain-containing protein n=1 Tax=Oryza nivara TaxID=4536 RepID=A0A0E0IEJ7_ORYNI